MGFDSKITERVRKKLHLLGFEGFEGTAESQKSKSIDFYTSSVWMIIYQLT